MAAVQKHLNKIYRDLQNSNLLMSTTTKSIDMQQAFPMEIYFRIFKFIPASSTTSFAQTSKLFYSIASDSHSVSNTIEKFFGSRKQSLCRAVIFILNPQRSWNLDSILSDDTIPANKSASLSKALTAQVATILYSRGAVIPRYLTQLVVKDGGLFKPELFGWLVNTSIIQFGCDAKLHSDDHSSVTKIVMDASLSHWAREVSNAASEENTELISLRKLVVDYKYMPINCSSKSGNVSYFLFKLANMDMSLIDAMNSNGYDLKSLNDEVMKWVLRKQTGSPLKTLRMFLNHGFEMTPVVVGHGLQLSRPDILEALNELVQPQELQKFASDTVIDLLGPKRIYTTDGILDHIRESFGISDSIIETALLNVPKDSLFKTRPFNQQHPSTAYFKFNLDGNGH